MTTLENVHTEKALVGVCLRDTSAFFEARGTGLKFTDFAHPIARDAWYVMENLSREGVEHTFGAVKARLGKYDDWLMDAKICAPAKDAVYWAREVIAAAYARTLTQRLADAAKKIATREPFSLSGEEIRSRVIAELRLDEDVNTTCATQDIKAITDALCLRLTIPDTETPKAIQTGFSCIDAVYGGIKSPDFWVIAARPSVGKTTLALNIAVNAALESRNVIFFSCEMSEEQIVMKAVSSLASVTTEAIESISFSEDEGNRTIAAMEQLGNSGLRVNAKTASRLEMLMDETRRLHRRGKCDLVVVDYLQLVRAHGKWESRVRELTHITSQLKTMALALHVPIVACAQINREGARRATMSNLKDSGSLEQDADVVALLERDDNGQHTLFFEKFRRGKAHMKGYLDADLQFHRFSDKNRNVEVPR